MLYVRFCYNKESLIVKDIPVKYVEDVTMFSVMYGNYE